MSGESNSELRYWKISPGEGAKFWDEWRERGFVAVGWNDLGDVSKLTEPEFEVRRDELILQHEDWTEARLDQVWEFAHINEGDRVVANQGITKVLGIGTVSRRQRVFPCWVSNASIYPASWLWKHVPKDVRRAWDSHCARVAM